MGLAALNAGEIELGVRRTGAARAWGSDRASVAVGETATLPTLPLHRCWCTC